MVMASPRGHDWAVAAATLLALTQQLFLTRRAAAAEETADTVPTRTGPKATSSVEVVVTGARPLTRDTTADTTRVSGRTLQESPRGSTLDALSQESADLYVSAGGVLHGVSDGSTGGVHMRGLGGSPNSQVLVVEDGIPDFQGIFGHPIPDAYAPALIDQALVIKGGDSVLYGTNALGGVIALSSRWRTSNGYELINDVGYGSYATLKESATWLSHWSKTDLSASLQTLSSDGHRPGAGGNLAVGLVGVRYHFTPTVSLTIRDKYTHLHGANPGPASHPYLDHWYNVSRHNALLQFAWTPRGSRLTLSEFANVGEHRLYDGFLSTDHTTGTLLDFETRLHESTILILGAASNQVGGRVEDRIAGTEPPVSPICDVAAYNQLTVKPQAPLTLTAGTRELYSSKYGSVLLYKAGARLELLSGLSAHARITRNFRQPTLRELYLPFPTANPNLRPETSVNSDAGIGYVSKYLNAEATVFRTAATDLIRYYGVWPSAEVVNIDHIVINGVQGQLMLKHLGPVTLRISANKQDVGRYTRQNPNAKVNTTLEWNQDFDLSSLTAALSSEWVHGLYMADYHRQPMDDVFFIDATLRYRHFIPERQLTLEPYLYLRNLLDHRYAYVADYPMPGFNAFAGLKIEI